MSIYNNRELAKVIGLKPVFVNKNVYDKVTKELGYIPLNLEVCNYLPDTQGICFDSYESLEEKPKFTFKPIPMTDFEERYEMTGMLNRSALLSQGFARPIIPFK